MRIIAGEFRGRSLESVRDLSVRPTTDRAKQTIFDILSNRIEFDRLDVLDLFAANRWKCWKRMQLRLDANPNALYIRRMYFGI